MFSGQNISLSLGAAEVQYNLSLVQSDWPFNGSAHWAH